MRINQISIKNLLGVEQFEIKPGSVTIIQGKNASGKTSILESIKAALGGGHDGMLLRRGAEEGEVVLVLEDGMTISKRITADRSTLAVNHPQLGKVSAGQSHLNKLVDSLSVNPVEFLAAPKKKRVELLLEAIPMTLAEKDLDAAGVPDDVQILDLEEHHALEVITDVCDVLFKERTGINRSAKDKRSTAKQMRETLPEEPENGDWCKKHGQLTLQLKQLEDEKDSEIETLKMQVRIECDTAKEHCDKEIEELKAEAARKIKRIENETAKKIRAWESKKTEKVSEINEHKDTLAAQIETDYQPRHRALSEEVGRAEAMSQAQAKAETTRQFISQQEKEAGELESESKNLTTVLSNLEDLKSKLLAKLPIKGLEVKDGEIFLEGIPFEHVNDARRIELAIEVAKLRSGELGLVAVDGLETLDKKHFETFRKMAAKSGLQFIVSRVSDGDLAVVTEKEAVNA
jgi:DNA repair exonuclease SbcCD ATPase subunit